MIFGEFEVDFNICYNLYWDVLKLEVEIIVLLDWYVL